MYPTQEHYYEMLLEGPLKRIEHSKTNKAKRQKNKLLEVQYQETHPQSRRNQTFCLIGLSERGFKKRVTKNKHKNGHESDTNK